LSQSGDQAKIEPIFDQQKKQHFSMAKWALAFVISLGLQPDVPHHVVNLFFFYLVWGLHEIFAPYI
jgi:hypothetical protein